MRLLVVRLQNLNSLSGTHEVRFDVAPLSAAGVFLITGPTGAGKSTLLDAMTLALYGRAARYGNDKADEMMSRHTAECFAEVDFETGGRKLRATWRLGKTKTGNLRPVQRTLADATTLEILADKGREVDPLIESLTGLDYNRFMRSVLLAQGQFAAFLKAKPNERAELLEKITGTEIYSDLSVLAYETHKAKEEIALRLKERLGAVTVLDDESRAKLESSLSEAKVAAEGLNAKSQTATRQLHEQREHATIAAEITKLTESGRILKISHAEALATVEKSKATADEAKQQRTKREPVWDKATSIETESKVSDQQLLDAQDKYRVLRDQTRSTTATREAAEKALVTHIEAAQVLEAWLKQNAGDADLADALPKMRVAVREWRVAFEKLAEGRKRHAETQALNLKINEAEAQTAALTKKAADGSTKAKTERAELERLAKTLEAQREVTRQADLVAGFDEHRHDLKDGEACPLCGALEHPFASAQTNFESQLQTARKLLVVLEKQYEKANRDVATLERELAKNEAEVSAERKRIAEMRSRAGEIVVPDIAMLEGDEETKRGVVVYGEPTSRRPALFGDDSSPLPSDAERELDALDKRAGVFAKKKQEAVQKLSERQKLEGDIQLTKQEEATKTKRLEELKAEGLALKTKADVLKQSLVALLGGKSLSEDRQQHEASVSTAEKAWRDAEAKLNALQTQIAATKAKLEQLEVRRKPFEGQTVLSAEALSEIEANAKRLNNDFATKRTELGSLEQQLRSDVDARQRRDAGGAELQAAEAGALRWGRLKELIGSADGAKFSRFAQSLTLRQLIGKANEHLKVLAERYRLMAAVGDELDLRIVDLYQANVDRPMESLSGGESFLASLALALGLSELASRLHPIDSLFIDEGFSSLDSETLEVALSALENLRTQGKTIGLISHVDLLKDRLTTQVRVIRGSGGTSRIEVVA